MSLSDHLVKSDQITCLPSKENLRRAMSMGRKGLMDNAGGTCTDLHPRAQTRSHKWAGLFPSCSAGDPRAPPQACQRDRGKGRGPLGADHPPLSPPDTPSGPWHRVGRCLGTAKVGSANPPSSRGPMGATWGRCGLGTRVRGSRSFRDRPRA